MDLDEMSNLYRRSSIDASYQVSRQTPSDGKSSHCLWQGELQHHEKTKSAIEIQIKL
jgi:hypothetical protein